MSKLVEMFVVVDDAGKPLSLDPFATRAEADAYAEDLRSERASRRDPTEIYDDEEPAEEYVEARFFLACENGEFQPFRPALALAGVNSARQVQIADIPGWFVEHKPGNDDDAWSQWSQTASFGFIEPNGRWEWRSPKESPHGYEVERIAQRMGRASTRELWAELCPILDAAMERHEILAAVKEGAGAASSETKTPEEAPKDASHPGRRRTRTL